MNAVNEGKRKVPSDDTLLHKEDKEFRAINFEKCHVCILYTWLTQNTVTST